MTPDWLGNQIKIIRAFCLIMSNWKINIIMLSYSCASNQSPTDLSKQILIYDSKALNNICWPQHPKLLDNIRSAAFFGEILNAFVNL